MYILTYILYFNIIRCYVHEMKANLVKVDILIFNFNFLHNLLESMTIQHDTFIKNIRSRIETLRDVYYTLINTEVGIHNW